LVQLIDLLIANINALEHCPGISADSQEDLLWPFNASSIVVYGTVTEVNNNTVTLKISCRLKGQLTEPIIQLNQVSEVNNINECHYLTAKKGLCCFH